MSVHKEDDVPRDDAPLLQGTGDKVHRTEASAKGRVTLALMLAMLAALLPAFSFGYHMGFMAPAECAMKLHIFGIKDCTAANPQLVNLFSSIHFIGAIPGAVIG